MKISILILLILTVTSFSASGGDNNPDRLTHAMELLGKKSFKASGIAKTENFNIQSFVSEATNQFLPENQKSLSKKIAHAILTQADNHGFDPIFLVALIQNESSFNTKKKGSFGEIGLMQVKPSTAEWIAKLYHIPYQGEKSLYNPEINIQIGVAYIFKLRTQFNSKSDLYISAYNMGAVNVRRILAQNETPHEYRTAVMSRYLAIYRGFNGNGSEKQKGFYAFRQVAALTQ
jgi:soluble lytic murein transglycosylase